MSEFLTEDQLENMTTEDIMNLTVDNIQELTSNVPPEGLYSGTVLGWELPSNDNNESFVPSLGISAVIELEDPEVVWEPGDDSKVSVRYSRKYNTALSAMRTAFADFFVKVGEGHLGNAMSNGDGTQVNFRIEHRYVTKDGNGKVLPKPKGPYAEIKDVTVV